MIVIKRCIHAHMCSVYIQGMTYVTHTHTHSSGHAATFGYCHSRRKLCPHTHVISFLNAHTYMYTYPASPATNGLLLLFSTLHAARASFVCFTHTHSAFPHTLPGVSNCLPV